MSKSPKKRQGKRLPSLRLHRPSGLAVCTINGRDIYCGKHGTPESERRYREVLAEWLAGRLPTGKPAKAEATAPDLTVAELALKFLTHAKTHYTKNDEPTSEQALLRRAIRPAVELFGAMSVNAFGPTCLRAVREHYIAKGWSRISVNGGASRLRRMFRFGVSHELVRPEVVVALGTVEPLKRGRTAAPETKGTQPVADDVLEKVLPHCEPTLRAALVVQRRTGMRAGELLQMTPNMLDRSGPIWWYRPARHKGEHHGKERRVAIGPRAQEAIGPLLPKTRPDQPVFKSIVRPGRPLSPHNFAQRVKNACVRAGVQPFRPHALRHARLRELRLTLGLDAAMATAGHSKVDQTAHYSRIEDLKSEEAAKASG